MTDSVLYWCLSAYKDQLPQRHPAEDAAYSASELNNRNPPKTAYSKIQGRFDAQQKRWQKLNREAAQRFGSRFADKVLKESAKSFNSNAEKAALGVTVKKTGTALKAVTKLQRDRMIATIAYLFNDTLQKQLEAFRTSFIRGSSPQDVRKHILEQFRKAEKKAGNQSRYMSANATNIFSLAFCDDLNLTRAIWVHFPGKKFSRHTHVEMNGKEFDIRKGMYDPDPKVKRFIQPGELEYCLPGDLQITFTAPILKFSRHFYAGELLHLVTADNCAVRCTPNHRILTDRGFIAAENLQVGDYLVRIMGENFQAADLHQNQRIPCIADLYQAAARFRSHLAHILDCADRELYRESLGDEVDIVDAAGLLLDNVQPAELEPFADFILTWAAAIQSGRAGGRAALFSEFRMMLAAQGRMSGLGVCLSLLWRELGLPQALGLMAIAAFNAMQDQEALDDLTADSVFLSNSEFGHAARVFLNYAIGERPQPGIDIGVTSLFTPCAQIAGQDPCLLTGFCNRHPAVYQFKRLQSARRERFSGHVYNLNTYNQMYNANYITMHNCMCTYRLLRPDKNKYGFA